MWIALAVAMSFVLAQRGSRGAWLAALATAILVLLNLAMMYFLRKGSPVAAGARRLREIAGAQLLAAVLMWGLIAVAGGGVVSPVLVVVVLCVAIGASLLPQRDAYLLAAGAGAWFVVLLVGQTLGAYGFDPVFGFQPPPPTLPVAVGMSVLVVVVFFLSAYFTVALLARLRRINQRLVEANRRLEGLDLAKSRFLRISAHQLRSPLAAVHTMLSAIQEAGGLNHQQYEIVRKIQTKSEDAMTLVDEMMLLSTVRESAAEVRELRPCDVDAAVRAEVEAFSPAAGAKRLTLCIDAQSGATVHAWDDALETVLEHLISNAVKYTPSGGSISVATRRCDAGVELKVTDTGIGIPPEQKDGLFREFFRATNARQVAGGTGMGLAIVQAIVGRLGGTISIDSTQDKGTAVTVVLPITEGPAAQVAAGAEDAEIGKTAANDADSREHRGENDNRLETPMTQGRLKPAK